MKVTNNKAELTFLFDSLNEVEAYKKQIEKIILISFEENKKKNIRFLYVGKYINKKEEEFLKDKFLKIKDKALSSKKSWKICWKTYKKTCFFRFFSYFIGPILVQYRTYIYFIYYLFIIIYWTNIGPII